MLTNKENLAIIYYGVFMMNYNYIEINPGIAGGSPVFKGTRIPLYTILDFISAGNTVEEILQHYPRLTEAHIKEAVKYASDSLKYKEIFLEIPA
jgi:uncharacterized protein (DUF433 family)